MKKNIPINLAIAALLMSMASCTRDDGPQVYYDDYDTESKDPAPGAVSPNQGTPDPVDDADTNALGSATLTGTNLNITTRAGQFQMEVGTNITPPEILLSEMPINNQAQIVNCLKGPDAIFATYSTQQSEEEAFAFYKEEIPNMGWEFQGAFDIGGRQMLTAYKDEHRLTITFQNDGDERVFHVMVSKRREDPADGERRPPPSYHSKD